MEESNVVAIKFSQRVAILVDGNNIGIGIHDLMKDKNAMLNFRTVVPKILNGRELSGFYYFREGINISEKLEKMIHDDFHGQIIPCGKSVDVQLAVTGIEVSDKVDAIILLSGDGDYLPFVDHLKKKRVRIEVVAVKSSVHRTMKTRADLFTEITDADCFVFKTYPATKTNA